MSNRKVPEVVGTALLVGVRQAGGSETGHRCIPANLSGFPFDACESQVDRPPEPVFGSKEAGLFDDRRGTQLKEVVQPYQALRVLGMVCKMKSKNKDLEVRRGAKEAGCCGLG